MAVWWPSKLGAPISELELGYVPFSGLLVEVHFK
jgi:hypothetical protein